MANELTSEQWAAVDSCIVAGDILRALKNLREFRGISLNEAKEIHWSRYQRLRVERPLDLACSDEEYGSGVYG